MRDFVCCILPCRERYDFVDRAIRCFRAQTHFHKVLMIWDTSPFPGKDLSEGNIVHIFPEKKDGTVGALRNAAVAYVPKGDWDYIAHFDFDDISMPDRLSRQVQFIQETGVEVVGMNDMAFYDAVRDRVLYYDSRMTNYALGTSLFYKREAWERVKFPDITPEDTTWQHQIGHDNIRGCSSIVDGKPIMIQVLHGGNAAANASGAIFEKASAELEKQVREILANA